MPTQSEAADRWQRHILASMAMRKVPQHKRRMANFYLRVRPQMLDLLTTAANVRGCTRSAWARRVLVVALAHDLQMDVREVAAMTPHHMSFFRTGRESSVPADDDAEGIEQWCMHPGCDGAHLVQPVRDSN